MPVDGRDIVGVVGIALIAAGTWWMFPPASLVITGGLLLAGALLSAKARR